MKGTIIMATVKTIKRKRCTAYQIGYTLHGVRRWLSLGSYYQKEDAEEIALVVDKIVASLTTGLPLDCRTQLWLDHAPDDLLNRLARSELIRAAENPTFEELFESYLESESTRLKPGTMANKRHAIDVFCQYVNPSTRVGAFSKWDASQFETKIANAGRFSEATKAGLIRDLRRVFNWAKNLDMVKDNPFDGIKRGNFKNKSREYYVSMSDYYAMLDACPSKMWRALIALYRIGGLRRGEALLLRWRDIDFARGRILVHSPKTERHAGGESRIVPMFPELRQELEGLWDETQEGGSPYLIPVSKTTIGRVIEQIVFHAGLNRWERLLQNLRSSRAIEIAREFGELAESEWIGHSPQTAKDHYLHVLDSDFARAIAVPETIPETIPETSKEPIFKGICDATQAQPQTQPQN
jgi:integrase